MSYTLGIDLGTTFTSAAIARAGRVETVGLGNHAATVPSVVFLRSDGELLVGDPAQRRGLQEPDRLAREFKRRFGDATPILLGHTPYSAERLMATVLRQVVDQVTERYGGPPSAVAIAHPANWGPYKIELLHQAVQLAGLSTALFVTEPEASAVNFAAGERVEPGEIVAVYDLGGGTFDAAVLRRTDDGFETLGEPQGMERIGGIDFDQAVLSHVRATLGSALDSLDQSDPAVRAAIARLRTECIAAKETLSEDSETTISVMLPGVQTQVRLTRNEFEDMIRPPVRETVATLQRAITSAGVTPADVKAIVLAGGSSRIPLVAEMVSGELGRPVALDAHPKHTVALGAARLAEQREHLQVRPSAGDGASTTAPTSAEVPAAATTPAAPTAPPPVAPAHAAPSAAPSTPTEAAAATPPPSRPAAPPSGGSGSRGKRIALGLVAALVVVAAAVGGVLALGGGDDSGEEASGSEGSETAVPDDTTVTTTTAVTPTCVASSGLCAVIDSITIEDDHFLVAYSTVGYEPKIDDGDPASHHIHFFYDSVPVERAGLPVGDGTDWVVWDVDERGQKFFRSFRVDDVPEGAGSICAIVATHDHHIDEGAVPSCRPLP